MDAASVAKVDKASRQMSELLMAMQTHEKKYNEWVDAACKKLVCSQLSICSTYFLFSGLFAQIYISFLYCSYLIGLFSANLICT